MKKEFRAVIFLLLAIKGIAADEVYMTTVTNTPARLSNGSLVTVKTGSCFPFLRHDLSNTFVQLQFGSFTAWMRKANISFVSKAEMPTAAARYAAEAKILARRTASYRSPNQASRWIGDEVTTVAPAYPREEKLSHHEGTGLFHVIIDWKTGLVTNVAIKKSTGFKRLDECAVAALRQWTWIPGTWRELDFPITYKMASGPPRSQSAERHLPNSL